VIDKITAAARKVKERQDFLTDLGRLGVFCTTPREKRCARMSMPSGRK
jgi:hypothetical protein